MCTNTSFINEGEEGKWRALDEKSQGRFHLVAQDDVFGGCEC